MFFKKLKKKYFKTYRNLALTNVGSLSSVGERSDDNSTYAVWRTLYIHEGLLQHLEHHPVFDDISSQKFQTSRNFNYSHCFIMFSHKSYWGFQFLEKYPDFPNYFLGSSLPVTSFYYQLPFRSVVLLWSTGWRLFTQ